MGISFIYYYRIDESHFLFGRQNAFVIR